MGKLSDFIIYLTNVIIGCTACICGTIILFLFWPIGVLIQILGIAFIFEVINIYDIKDKK